MGFRKGDTVRVGQTIGDQYDMVHGQVGTITLTLGIGGQGEHDCFWVEIPDHPASRWFPERESIDSLGLSNAWPLMSEEVELVSAAPHV